DCGEDALGECRDLPRRAAIRLHLGLDVGADLQRALTFVDFVSDRRALDGYDLTDELREIGERAPKFPGPDVDECLLLIFARLVVDDKGGFPVALHDVARHVAQHHKGPSGHVGAVDGSLVKVVANYRIASAVVWVLPDPAGTEHVAVTDLENAS